MNNYKRSSESGQALVLVVLAIVALLGFTALAVDGSMVYSDRRHAQNAADASALAGGAMAALEIEKAAPGLNYVNWPCTASHYSSSTVPTSLNGVASKARQATATSADENGFVFLSNESAGAVQTNKHGVYVTCGVDTVSQGGATIFKDKFLEVHSLITKRTSTSFAHFVFGGPLINSVNAVARVRPRQNLAYGFAIVALNPAACSGNTNGGIFRGSSLITVDGGGIYANNCLDQDGSGPNFHVDVLNAGVAYCTHPNNDDFSAFNVTPVSTYGAVNPNECVQIPQSLYTIDEPDCSDPAAHNVSATQFENQAEVKGSSTGLEPGLWCVTGDVQFAGKKDYAGAGVTIYLKDGDMDTVGAVTTNFSAPNSSNPSPAINGMLIYAPPSNTGIISLNGNSNSHWLGTILATGATVNINGSEEVDAFQTQVIAWNVNVGGSSDTYIQYNSAYQSEIPTRIDLWH
jgi:Flp pilus assembly protein TadG